MAFDVKKNILMTIAGKSTILVLNFLVVVLSTRLWGAEGRGLIAMFVADVSLLAIVANIFTGSSVSFFLAKVGARKLFSIALLWVSVISIIGALFFHIFEVENLSLFFFVISLFSGLIAFFNSLFVGGQKIREYNTLTVMQPFLLLLFMLLFYYFVDSSYRAYFYAQMLSLSILSVSCLFIERKNLQLTKLRFSMPIAIQSFQFGFQTELSNFLQFFNYRLSYYFLSYYVGDGSVGVFSIGVMLSEAIWIVSRSISMVQYSRLLQENNQQEAISGTNIVAKYSFIVTLIILLIANILPSEVYTFIFGRDFADVKEVLLMLSPGVLAIAVSNVFGHYFSAKGKLQILVRKSMIGVFVTLILSFLIIEKWQILGASITNMVSNLVTSIVLFVAYWIEIRKNK